MKLTGMKTIIIVNNVICLSWVSFLERYFIVVTVGADLSMYNEDM